MLFFWCPVLRPHSWHFHESLLSAVLSNAILALSGTVHQFPSAPYIERLSQASRTVSFLPSSPLFLLAQHLNSHVLLPFSCTHTYTLWISEGYIWGIGEVLCHMLSMSRALGGTSTELFYWRPHHSQESDSPLGSGPDLSVILEGDTLSFFAHTPSV